ncbi:hypothetical protein AB4876_15110 [Zhongshania guokunii]|jgi:hypothetical protein|uniref:Uncharacterized protein n=1 Tax=Zhongshania guokunii TaxID=641783 RepID=A0ABV3U8P7_9GAMM
MNNFIRFSLLVIISSAAVTVYAEQEPTHKHYKATMPGESHSNSESATKTDKNAEAMPTHKNYKATMPGESHQDYKEGNYPKSTNKENDPTHKHYKATMEGEKHNQ